MLNISKFARTFAASAVIAAAATASQAATLTIAESGDNFDLLADSYTFDEDFAVGTAGGMLSFSFTNNSASTAAVTFFGVSVNQNLAAFTDGVQVTFDSIVASFAEGETGGMDDQFFVAAGETVTLEITYGSVFDLPPAFPTDAANIDFTVQAAVVPVPAAGLLLLTALGAAGALRRRKAATAA